MTDDLIARAFATLENYSHWIPEDEWKAIVAERDLAIRDAARIATQQEAIDELVAGLPHDIRAKGWAVAVHNDYRLHGVHHTFWLFTKDGQAVKGEGLDDAAALNQVRALLSKHGQRT